MTTLYDLLAALLVYPGDDFDLTLAAAWQAALEVDPEAAEELAEVRAGTEGLDLIERQELYTRTFDLNPVCALEVGWQLFGEEYHRGVFLVAMRDEHRKLGLPEATELPDHLSQVLPVLARMAPPERADGFATACVLPALGEMLTALAGQEHPYEHLLRAVERALVAVHGPVPEEALHA